MKVRQRITVAAIGGVVAALLGATTAVAVPAQHTVSTDTTIEAEDFNDTGFSDTTAKNIGGQYRSTAVDLASDGKGFYVGWTAEGEHVEYTLNFAQAGRYSAEFTLASNQPTSRLFRVLIDGRTISGTQSFNGSNWLSWGMSTLDLGTVSAGAHTLRIVFVNGKLDLDRFRLTTAVTPPALLGGTSGSYPGRPAAGDVHWGAFYRPSSGSDDPRARYENAAGQPLEVRRTYFDWGQRTTSMISTASADIAAGRLPWVSIKPPSWAAMGSGNYNAEIDQMLRALDGLKGPVWLTIHHEPEGGGGNNVADDPAGPAGHLAMNKKVRERMKVLGVDNVALGAVLMEWTFNPQSGRNADQYWAPGVYDFLGIDTYSLSGESFLDSAWQNVRTWAASKGVDVAVGEYGIRGTGTASVNVMREFYQAALASGSDGKGARVAAITVFDSGPKGWTLPSQQLAAFRQILSEQ